jgi:Uma2 family endonuclease
MVCVDGAAYILRRDPDLVRVPDISFVARDHIPEDGLRLVFWPFAPDLAIEIVSPNDRPGEVQTKVGEYLAAGSRAVWVMWPERRALTVHWPDGGSIELGPDDEIGGGDVLPGFRVKVGALFDTDA